jgi:hypothetical protein
MDINQLKDLVELLVGILSITKIMMPNITINQTLPKQNHVKNPIQKRKSKK